MSITIPKSAPVVQVEPGTYIARCFSMVHIGTIEYDWNGQKNKSNKVRINFELPNELKVFKEGEGAKPVAIAVEYSLSFGKKSKLRPELEKWRGKAFTEEEMDNFDITKLVGVPAFITITENEKGYSEITGITKLPKGTECPSQINQSFILDYNENWSEEKFNQLPEFIRKKMVETPEYKALHGEEVAKDYPSEDITPSDIPF